MLAKPPENAYYCLYKLVLILPVAPFLAPGLFSLLVEVVGPTILRCRANSRATF